MKAQWIFQKVTGNNTVWPEHIKCSHNKKKLLLNLIAVSIVYYLPSWMGSYSWCDRHIFISRRSAPSKLCPHVGPWCPWHRCLSAWDPRVFKRGPRACYSFSTTLSVEWQKHTWFFKAVGNVFYFLFWGGDVFYICLSFWLIFTDVLILIHSREFIVVDHGDWK